MERTGLFDVNGQEYIRGQVVSLGNYFDHNEEFGYIEKEFGKWQVIGICKEWNGKTGFQIELTRVNNCKIVDNIQLDYSFEEVRKKLAVI